jgi:hypothetical protein
MDVTMVLSAQHCQVSTPNYRITLNLESQILLLIRFTNISMHLEQNGSNIAFKLNSRPPSLCKYQIEKAISETLGLAIENPVGALILSLHMNNWFLEINQGHFWNHKVVS